MTLQKKPKKKNVKKYSSTIFNQGVPGTHDVSLINKKIRELKDLSKFYYQGLINLLMIDIKKINGRKLKSLLK